MLWCLELAQSGGAWRGRGGENNGIESKTRQVEELIAEPHEGGCLLLRDKKKEDGKKAGGPGVPGRPFFFSTVASATAGMLCLITILLYILVQYFVNPGVLRTDPNYEDVKNANTWLLFLPLFPVQVQTLIVVIIGMVVLLLDLLGLVLLGQLLIFHIYLQAKKMTTFEYLIKTGKEESSKHQAARKDPHVQMEEGFLQQRDGALGSSTQGAKVKSSLLICKSPCHFCTSVNPDGDSSAKEAEGVPSLSSLGVKVRNSLQMYRRPCPFSSTVHPEGGSTAQECSPSPSP
ncbi:hypothetical protein H8958_007767, partial [Nasalis larvatus]